MNAKSERIEHLIQIVNRNLLLIFNGQVEGVTPVDPTSFLSADKSKKNNAGTQKIDMSVFDGDKFGYEMVNFFRMHIKSNKSSLAAIWERNFVKGVETLMMECAVIKDGLERECFVSRVYAWFTDKLVERRTLPGQDDLQYDEIELLKNTMSAMGAFHSVKALDNLSEQKAKADSEVLQQVLEPDLVKQDTLNELGLEGAGMEQLKLPPIKTKIIKHEEPVLVEDRPTGDQDGYEPETEAERVMHELWLARRRQEAFEWKAKQNLNLIMDRRDLHRSRLESEALRREETSSYLAGPQNAEDAAMFENSTHRETSRFAPKMRRPLSGKRHFANVICDIELDEDIQSTRQSIEGSSALDPLDATSLQETNRNIQVTAVNVVKEGAKSQTKVNSIARNVIQKNKKKPYVPMRFRDKAPDSFTAGTTSRNKNQDAFKVEIDKESTPICDGSHQVKPEVQHRKSTRPDKLSSTQKSSESTKRHSLSNKILRNLGANDSELQVHYQYSQTRKGPLTSKHRAWLQMQEEDRIDRDLAYNRKLRHSSGNDKQNEEEDEESMDPVPPKYSSAKDFMDKHFPVFDKLHHEEAHGPLRYSILYLYIMLRRWCHYLYLQFNTFRRQQQLLECEEVLESYEMNGRGPSNLMITREALEKGLLIPQDRPKVRKASTQVIMSVHAIGESYPHCCFLII